jgi:arginase
LIGKLSRAEQRPAANPHKVAVPSLSSKSDREDRDTDGVERVSWHERLISARTSEVVRTLPDMHGSGRAYGGWDLLVSPWHINERIEEFPVPAGAVELIERPSPAASELDRLAGRMRAAADAVAQTARPLMLAGDCLTSLALVAGLQSQHRDISVIWLDAHGDFNTPAISISGYLAGMSLAMLTGRAPEPICGALRLAPIPDERAILIGARDLDPAEREALDASHIRRLAADPGTIRSTLDERSADRVYLHVDVDIIDGEDLPGLRFPTDGGPSFSVVEQCLAQIVAAAPPVAVSIACAWAPDRIGDEPTRSAITRLARVVGAELQWPLDDTRQDQ